jgi:hypothetical protein
MAGSRTQYRGFINYVPQVHDTAQRDAAINYYGKDNMGKSNPLLYTNNFRHQNAITKNTELNIVERFYEGRKKLIETANDDLAFNPDFPSGRVTYGYVKTRNSINEIPFQGHEVAEESPFLSFVPLINPSENTDVQESLFPLTSDLSGKYTPNLSPAIDFNGENLPVQNSVLNGSGTGGYGNSKDAMSNEPPIAGPAAQKNDIHHNTFSGLPDTDEITNIRNNVVNNILGVINTFQEGRLGSFSLGVEKDGGAYEDALTIQQ